MQFTQNGQELYAANDKFLWDRQIISSAGYDILYRGSMSASSSGVIISTGLGQSGWYKSVIAQLNGGAEFLHMNKPSTRQSDGVIEELSFAVREPYPSINSGADIVMGKIKLGESLKLRSCMPENGVIFFRWNAGGRHFI